MTKILRLPDPLSANLAHLKGSETIAINAEARRLRGLGKDVIDLSVGEPDFDTPDSAALAPLLKESGFKDISEHPAFDNGGRPGTFGRCSEREKIDYILLSPALFARVKGGGVWRKGVWGPNKKPLWEVYPEMKQSFHAASDHACLWCDLDV